MNDEENNGQENDQFDSKEKGLLNRNKGKKGLSGEFLGKVTGAVMKKVFIAVLLKLVIVFMILIVIGISFDFIDKTVDRVTIEKTPEKMQEILKFDTDELQKLVTIKGSDEDGYYLGYIEDFDNQIKLLAKETRKTAGLRRTTEEMLEKIIRAELITQYPKLGEKKTLEEVKEIQARIKEREENGEEGGNGELETPEDTSTDTATGNSGTGENQGNTTPSELTSLDGFLFIGDSITEGLGETGQFPEAYKVCGTSSSTPRQWLYNETVPGRWGGPTYSTLPADSDSIKGLHVMLGTNNIGQITEMGQLLEKLHGDYPGRTIFVSKILPIPGYDVTSYNSSLESLCNSRDYLKIIDPTAGVQMGGDEHPSIAGYSTLGQNIRKAILEEGGGPVSSSSPSSSSSHGTPYTEQKGINIDNSYISKYDGFQGTIRIRRVMPNKNIGAGGEDVGRGVVSNTDTSYTSGSIKDIDEYLTGGQWGVYAKNLKTGKVEVNKNANASLKSASVIKLFIAAAAYDRGYANDGVVQSMISVSNNGSANKVIDDNGGISAINAYISSHGYSGTRLSRKFGAEYPAVNGQDNMISAQDVGDLLDKIYNNEIPGADKILSYMKAQERRNKIPAGLPAGVQSANKTGETGGESNHGFAENDAAIVYKDNAPYILVVLSNEASNAIENIRKISSAVYNGISGEGNTEEEHIQDNEPDDEGDSNGDKDKPDSDDSDEDELTDGSNQSSGKKHVVAVDPGHGIKGPFASSYENLALNEQDLANGKAAYTSGEGGEYEANKRVADLVAEKMQAQHPEIEVIQTGDEPNCKRLKIAIEKGAEAYIGVHHDGSMSQNYMGMTRDAGDSTSMSFATTIIKHLGSSKITSGEHTESGLRPYSVVKIPNMYTESKNRNPEEYAQGIVDGIIEYFGGKPAKDTGGTGNSADSDNSEDDLGSGVEEETSTNTASQISSKVFDMRFVSMEKFNELVENNSEEALKVYTLDEGRNLITAKWSYSSAGGIKITTNPPINFKSIMRKYITTFEYLYDYYAHLSEDDQYVDKFMNDFLENIYKSEFIIAVQDNVTTTQRGRTRTETVTDTIELTYADTWFIRAQKDVNYATATVQTTVGGGDGGTGETVSGENNFVAEQGELIGNFWLTCFCYACNDDGAGNFGTNVTASGNPATPGISIAVHKDDFYGSGDPRIKKGSYVIINGEVRRVDDCNGANRNGGEYWADVYINTGAGGQCVCDSSPIGGHGIPVYVAKNVREAGSPAPEGTNENTDENSNENKPAKTETTVITGTLNAKGEAKTVKTTSGGITTTTTTVKYDTGEDFHVTMKEKQFREMFEKNPKIWASLEPEWLIELVEQNATQMLDITKYYLNKLANQKIFPDIDEIKLQDLFETFADNEFADAGGVLPGGTGGIGISGGSIQAKVWVALRKLGYSEEATAGAMGNIHYESGGFNPSAIEGGTGIGIGLCQWSYGRRDKLEAYARSKGKDWRDEDIQVEFLVAELTQGSGIADYQLLTTARATPSQFINAKSVQDATIAFCWSFERPRVDAGEKSMPQRIDAALKYYDEFAGRPLESIARGGNGDILEACEEVARRWMARGVSYSIMRAGEGPLPTRVEDALDTSHYGCCATYTSTVLYCAGLLDASQINSYAWHWTGSGGVPDMLANAGWTRVNPAEKQPGDVIIKYEIHVCIYAGGNLIYDQDAGINGRGPEVSNDYATNPSYQVWRAPN